VPKHKLYSAILQETKKTSADFIQVQLTSMISNTETISSVRKSPVSLGTCNKNLLIRKRSFMFPRTVDESEHDKEKAITTTVTMETKRIPIYIHFSTQRYIIYITNDSLRDIQKGILGISSSSFPSGVVALASSFCIPPFPLTRT
jgi:hypothetical protein